MGIKHENEFDEENFRKGAEILLKFLIYIKTGVLSMIVAIAAVGICYLITPHALHGKMLAYYAWAFFSGGALSNFLFDGIFTYNDKDNIIHIDKMVEREKKNKGIDVE